MTTNLQFTDEEIRSQLELLGFKDVSHQQLENFKIELHELLQLEMQNDISASKKIENEHPASEIELNHVERNRLPILKTSGNVVIEKLPVDAFDSLKLQAGSQTLQSNKENCVQSDHPLLSSIDNLRLQMDTRNMETRSEVGSQENDRFSVYSSDSTASLVRKRKVLRKKHGKVNVEISGSTETPKSQNEGRSSECVSQTNRSDDRSESTSSSTVHKKWRSVSDLGITKKSIYRSKSVLLPYSNNSQGHVCFKSDPVALFHYYKREWSNFNIPGEKDHRELRWNIRQALAMGNGINK